ncbi:NAD(P)/FAD-dependent oxidoreductase [Paraburkholderia phenoliruptrix]|uniref:NAD(P)/FAD-dependent oxidoreductase n=1 Tax=Paraburkholderia phenoliruptrix TaxID=252970 RepID=UPI00286985EE|nr:FAD-dependent oxidoreductase [Paraburkholderia phenoliruptrix]WMY11008.1 FAD-dependent oxidoreductase [Paraburkholderia phenoliruptrix]
MDAIVVGAGVIGVTAALALQERGLKVMLLDGQTVAQGCSSVNAGVIYQGAFPFSTYYRIPDLPAAFFSATAPAALDWRSAPSLLSWGVQYAKATRSDMVWHGTDLLHELCRNSLHAFGQLLGPDLPELNASGYLAVHLSDHELDRAKRLNSIRKSLGAAARMVSNADLVALEPAMCGLTTRHHAVGASFLEGSVHVADPASFLSGLLEVFAQRSGIVRVDKVLGIESKGARGAIVRCGTENFSPRAVVLATGAGSNKLLADCNHRVPLLAEKGYELELDVERGFITRPVALPSFGLLLTPSQLGARISGLSHFGLPGFRARPGLLLSALQRLREIMPVLRPRSGFEVRSGERPATPDSLPIVERVPGHPCVFVSTGHGHLGFTLSAISSSILADMVTDGVSSYASELSSQRFRTSTRSRAALLQATY